MEFLKNIADQIIAPYLVLIIASFFPLMLISFFRFKIAKKKRHYSKTLQIFGISKNHESKLDEAFGFRNYILPLLFVTSISFVASYVIVYAFEIFPYFDKDYQGEIGDNFILSLTSLGTEDLEVQRRSLVALLMAFLGSFLWSARDMITRLINEDLPPSVFYWAGLRMILAAIVALVLSFIFGGEGMTGVLDPDNVIPWLSLDTGMFPDRIINYLSKRFSSLFSNKYDVNSRHLSLENIEGITLRHKERLSEENIESVQNLASASLTELIVNTPYEPRQILDWIGQAKLLCYAKVHAEKFRSVGIRSVFDFFKGDKSRKTLRELGELAGLPTPILEVVHQQVISDFGIRALYTFQCKLDGGAKDEVILPPLPSYTDTIEDLPHYDPKHVVSEEEEDEDMFLPNKDKNKNNDSTVVIPESDINEEGDLPSPTTEEEMIENQEDMTAEDDNFVEPKKEGGDVVGPKIKFPDTKNNPPEDVI